MSVPQIVEAQLFQLFVRQQLAEAFVEKVRVDRAAVVPGIDEIFVLVERLWVGLDLFLRRLDLPQFPHQRIRQPHRPFAVGCLDRQ